MTSLTSDHIALLIAFEAWKEAKCSGRECSFRWENFLSPEFRVESITLEPKDCQQNVVDVGNKIYMHMLSILFLYMLVNYYLFLIF
jgi:hypothetical protein